MGNGGAFFSSVVVVCSQPLFYSLGMNLYDQVRAGTVRVRGTTQCGLREGGGLPAVYARE